MVKLSTALCVAALIAGPVVAFSSEQEFSRELVEQDLYERDLAEAPHFYERDLAETPDLYERDLAEALDIRDQIYEIFGRDIEELTEREVQELFSRKVHISKGFLKFIHKITNVVKSAFRRELDEISARDLEEFDVRELIELAEREPVGIRMAFKVLFHKKGKHPSVPSGQNNQQNNQQNHKRNIEERDFTTEQMNYERQLNGEDHSTVKRRRTPHRLDSRAFEDDLYERELLIDELD